MSHRQHSAHGLQQKRRRGQSFRPGVLFSGAPQTTIWGHAHCGHCFWFGVTHTAGSFLLFWDHTHTNTAFWACRISFLLLFSFFSGTFFSQKALLRLKRNTRSCALTPPKRGRAAGPAEACPANAATTAATPLPVTERGQNSRTRPLLPADTPLGSRSPPDPPQDPPQAPHPVPGPHLPSSGPGAPALPRPRRRAPFPRVLANGSARSCVTMGAGRAGGQWERGVLPPPLPENPPLLLLPFLRFGAAAGQGRAGRERTLLSRPYPAAKSSQAPTPGCSGLVSARAGVFLLLRELRTLCSKVSAVKGKDLFNAFCGCWHSRGNPRAYSTKQGLIAMNKPESTASVPWEAGMAVSVLSVIGILIVLQGEERAVRSALPPLRATE